MAEAMGREAEWWHEPVAGALAGLVQEATTYPFDTIRVRLDTGAVFGAEGLRGTEACREACRAGPVASLWRACREMWRAEGWRGFYGGYGVNLALTGPTTALYFSSYKLCQRSLSALEGTSEETRNAAAGLGAEMCSAVVGTPGDVVAQRLQVAPVGTTTSQVLAGVLREGGPRQLWVGYWGYLGVWGPFSMTYFMVYEMLKPALCRRFAGHGTSQSAFSAAELGSGTVAGAAGALVTQPLDCIKTRLQVGRQALSPVMAARPTSATAVAAVAAPGAVGTLLAALREEGPQALMRGAAARALWLAPGSGLIIAVFESVQRLLAEDCGA